MYVSIGLWAMEGGTLTPFVFYYEILECLTIVILLSLIG